jgi:hypothetical protein
MKDRMTNSRKTGTTTKDTPNHPVIQNQGEFPAAEIENSCAS